jgi:hypothetical protein
MGSRGDAFNAACESCISTLKEEWIKRHRYRSRDEARLSIFRYIETFYNPRRRHSSLGGISPRPVRDALSDQTTERRTRYNRDNTSSLALRCQRERRKLNGEEVSILRGELGNATRTPRLTSD